MKGWMGRRGRKEKRTTGMEEGRKEERKGGRERGRKVEGEKEVDQIDEEVDDRQTNGLPRWC